MNVMITCFWHKMHVLVRPGPSKKKRMEHYTRWNIIRDKKEMISRVKVNLLAL